MSPLRILLLTESIPFPPRNGRELPTSQIFERISKRHHVDLLITKKKGDTDFDQRIGNVPNTIHSCTQLPVKRVSKKKLIWTEIQGTRPAFFSEDYEVEDAKKVLANNYDIIWISPVGSFQFIRFCRQHQLEVNAKIVMGVNDIKTYLYKDSWNELKSGRYGLNMQLLSDTLRTPFIRKCERNYLEECDAIHVQSDREKEKFYKITRKGIKTEVIVAPNGIKSELKECTYQGIDSNVILYMTHLAGGRQRESNWFLTQVWPELVKKHPQAELWLVGTPPKPNSEFAQNLPKGVKIFGYADDLKQLFNEVAGVVVPIIHSTGLINRVVDGITAGVPVVANRSVLKTVSGVEFEKNVLPADTQNEYVTQLSVLLSDKDRRMALSKASKELSEKLPTWELTTAVVENKLIELVAQKKQV